MDSGLCIRRLRESSALNLTLRRVPVGVSYINNIDAGTGASLCANVAR
jgi:hypothetical protein